MAETPTLLTSGTVNTGSATTATASVTPAADGAVLVAVYAHHATVAFTDTTAVSGCGLTWAKVATIRGNSDLEILTLFVGYGGSPSAGAISIVLSQAPAAGRYQVIQQKQQDTSANPAGYSNTNSGTGTTGTVAMAAANRTPGRRTYSFFGHRIAEATTPDSTGLTWMELDDQTTTTAALESQWVDGVDETASATWATSSSWLALAIELKASLYNAMRSNVLDAIDNAPHYDNWGTPSAGGEGRANGREAMSSVGQMLLGGPFNGVISGIVEEAGTPIADAWVALYDRRNGELIARKRSSGSGTFSFTHLPLGVANYYVVALDPTFNALIFDQLTPVV